MKEMKKMMIIPLLLFVAGCGNETPEPPVEKKYLVQTEEVANPVTKEMLQVILNGQAGYGQLAMLLQSNVRMLSVTYTTEHPKGNPLNVSGALLISEDYSADFPTVVFNHGTYFDSNSAPSVDIGKLFTPGANEQSAADMIFGLALASAFNCAVLLPDYIGYGESKSVIHPYVHVESLGQTGLDFIRAFREYMASSKVNAGDRVFITGYSEGGTAALALHKAIDAHPEEGLKVAGNVAGSGVYDMLESYRAFLGNPNPVDPSMLSTYLWVLGMFKEEFKYSKDWENIFSETDHATLQGIEYDLSYSNSLGLELSDIASELLHPDFIAGVQEGTDTEFINIMRQNSLVDFAPKDSLIFVYGSADNWVYPINSKNAYNKMREKGCKVEARVVTGGDHMTTIPEYIKVLVNWLFELSK